MILMSVKVLDEVKGIGWVFLCVMPGSVVASVKFDDPLC
jgi:hypothetical protein